MLFRLFNYHLKNVARCVRYYPENMNVFIGRDTNVVLASLTDYPKNVARFARSYLNNHEGIYEQKS